MATIKYSCVNEGRALIAEFPAGEQAKLGDILQRIIATIPQNEYRRKTIEDGKGSGVNFHYLANGSGKVFACAATPEVRMQIAFAFLEAVEATCKGEAGAAVDGKALKKTLQTKLEYYNNAKNDKIAALNEEISGVKNIMLQNMDKVIARGDQIDTMAQKSNQLVDDASKFQKGATKLKRMECAKNAKLTAAVIAVVLIVLLVILMIACKPNFSSCS